MTSANQIHPDAWDILPGESPEHFQAFKEYRDMAYPNGYGGAWARRTYEGARRIVFEKYGRKWDPDHFSQTANYFRWDERARAFDLRLDHSAGDLVSEAVKMKRAHLRRMAKAGEFAEAEMDRHIRRAEILNRSGSDVVPTTRPTEAVDILERATKVERLVMGESTENVGGGGQPVRVDLSGLSDAELEALAAIHAKLEKSS